MTAAIGLLYRLLGEACRILSIRHRLQSPGAQERSVGGNLKAVRKAAADCRMAVLP